MDIHNNQALFHLIMQMPGGDVSYGWEMER